MKAHLLVGDVLIWEGEAPAEPAFPARREPRPPKLGHYLLVGFGFILGSLLAAAPPAAPKKAPKITLVTPLGIAPGRATRLTIRGVNLETATEVRCQEPKATVKLLGKKGIGNGQSQAEAEVTLPVDYSRPTVAITVRTADGESTAHTLLIDQAPVVAEKEPNDGFRQAQPIRLPQEVEARIGQAKDVDLFRFEGQSGQRLSIEVFAAKHGSSLDALLTLYDADGRIVASCDDVAGSLDPRLEVKLAKAGVYYISVGDADDQGGATHVYRLRLRVGKP